MPSLYQLKIKRVDSTLCHLSLKMCLLLIYYETMIKTHTHTNQHAHKNQVAPQCLSVLISMFIFSFFTVCFPLFSSIPLCLVQ